MKMHGRFTGPKQSGCNYNQVTACTTAVAVSRGSTVLQNVTRYQRSCDNNNMVYPCKLDGRWAVASQTTHFSLFHFKIN